MREHIGCLAANVVAGDTDLAAAEMLDQRGMSAAMVFLS